MATRMTALVRAFLGFGFLFLGACQSVGAPERGPVPTPPSGTPVAVSDQALERNGSPTPPRILFGDGLGEHGLDAILHSPAAGDPRFQEQVQFWIGFWTGRQSDYFTRYLDRMGRYEALVDDEILARGLPISLRYLPIVESGYHPGAVSRVGATGLWQIMSPTAGDLGLAVGSIVDDRRDPVAATGAALQYLEQLHTQFGSWFLALAAYNAGQGRVGGLLDRYSSSDPALGDARFLEIRPHLPAENREFVPRFFAAAALAMNPEMYGFPPIVSSPFDFDEVIVPDATSLEVIARAAGASEEDVLALNPHFVRGFTPVGEIRTVRVPVGTGTRFHRNYAMLPPHERLAFAEHVVSPGETLSHIAQRYGVSVADLSGSNGGVDPRRLQIGTRLIVPLGMAGAPGRTEVRQVAASGGPGNPNGVHLVRAGESLWTIARRYGVTAPALAAANERSTEGVLRVGEELIIP